MSYKKMKDEEKPHLHDVCVNNDKGDHFHAMVVCNDEHDSPKK